jgi:hypothetical protein
VKERSNALSEVGKPHCENCHVFRMRKKNLERQKVESRGEKRND